MWGWLWVIVGPWASAQSLDLQGLVEAEDAALSTEYRRLRDQKLVESIARILELLDREGIADPTRAEMQLRLADLYFQQGAAGGNPESLRHAENLYSELLKHYPAYERADQATFFLGRTQLLLGEESSANLTFRTVVKQFPSSNVAPDAYLWLGELMAATSAYGALKAYLQASKFTEHRWSDYALYRVAWAYHELNEVDKAAEVLAVAAASDNPHVQAAAAEGFGEPGASPPTAQPVAAVVPVAPSPRLSPCEQQQQQHRAQASEPQGPQLQVQVIQCWMAQGDTGKAASELADLEQRYGPRGDWAGDRTRAERQHAKEMVRRGQALVDP